MSDDTVRSLRFDALRNAIYHTARRRFLDTQNRALSFVVVAAGTGAVGDLGKSIGIDAQFFAAIAALAGTLQLVFDAGGRARTHEFLQKRFYELAAEIADATEPGDQRLAHWKAALNRLYADEPPPMRALDAVAYNAARESLGYGQRVRLNWWQSLWRQWWPFHGSEFPFAPESTLSI